MKRFIDLLVKLQLSLATVFLVIFIIAVILQVATRYVPGFTALWTEQIANYSFIWAVLMGASVGVRNKEHFNMSFLADRLKGKVALANNILIQVMIGCFGIFIAYYGIELTKTFWNWSVNSLPQLKQRYVWMVMPVCGITMAIYAFYNAYEFFIGHNKVESLEKGGA
ncbi:MAG: C4-dicarboxylate transport system permease small protein [Peptococcaceae bacterium]|jgi:TRAP-type C4-dicarboxylate transport system permease small subunit|nr:C4-dicarboxylate transport system permease small protein [Peptococcaceae bacterium]